MKKLNLKVSLSLTLLLIVISISMNTEINSTLASTSSPPSSNHIKLDDLVVASPMIIDYDADFESYGFPGDGSPGDPYRIENLNITTTGDYCLNFGGYTTKHFIVQNCFLKTDTNYAIYIGKYANIGDGTVDIYNNEIISTGNDGLNLNGVVNGKIRENYIVSFSASISVDDSNFTYVHNNTVSAETGIEMSNSLGSTILRNICDDNSKSGIYIVNSNDTVIAQNNCSDNGHTGIVAEQSHDLTIISNYAINNFNGISVLGSSGSTITNNYIESNAGYGLRMQGSVGLNKIYHNAFINNNNIGTQVQAFDDVGDQWYDEVLEEGNYWDDWSGSSSSTYTIEGAAGSEDLYPLDVVPNISEYTNGFLSYILISILVSIPLVLWIKRRN